MVDDGPILISSDEEFLPKISVKAEFKPAEEPVIKAEQGAEGNSNGTKPTDPQVSPLTHW